MATNYCHKCTKKIPSQSHQLRHLIKVIERVYDETYNPNTGDEKLVSDWVLDSTCEVVSNLLVQLRANLCSSCATHEINGVSNRVA